MASVSLRLLVLKTPQVDRLRDFYQAIGIELAEEQHGNGPVHYAGQVGNAVLEIYPMKNEGGTADTTTRLGFAVERLAEVVQALRDAGATFTSEPRQTAWGPRAVARDPDGRTVELYQT
jgi:catechol 2,3-dioxygenase-like lactoylglutathione lyase family enzyme